MPSSELGAADIDPPERADYCARVTQDGWPSRLTSVIAREVRRYRELRKLSAQQLANRCAAIGSPMHRSVIANLETGRRPLVSIAELLVLAAALEVPPLLLVIPLGSPDSIEMLPGFSMDTWDAEKWWSGHAVPEIPVGDGVTIGRDVGNIPVLNYARLHADLVFALETASRSIHTLTAAFSEILGEDTGGANAMLSQYLKSTQQLSQQLKELREAMREEDLLPPPLPLDLQFIDGGTGL